MKLHHKPSCFNLTIKTVLVLLVFGFTRLSYSAELLFNGDFETGSIQGWNSGSLNGGIVAIAAENSCFSDNDTSQLSIEGNYAAMIRSAADGDPDSIGALTSDAFTAGNGIAFIAISESTDNLGKDFPVSFEVHLTDTDGNTLSAHKLKTSVIRLSVGCPSSPRSAAFSAHYIDTRPYLDQTIRIQFRQRTLSRGLGLFTLIDNVIKFSSDELPIFTSRPQAVAGISETSEGKIRLDGSLSIDPDDGPEPLSYSWLIDGSSIPVLGEYSCIDDDFKEGDHTVTLSVSDGVHVDSDTMKFVFYQSEKLIPSDVEDATNDETTRTIFIDIDGCSGGEDNTSTTTSTTTSSTDGSSTTTNTDGSTTVTNSDGTTTTTNTDGSITTTNADGSTTTTYTDGSSTTINADGSTTTNYADGSSITTNTDGSTTTIAADGTTTTTN